MLGVEQKLSSLLDPQSRDSTTTPEVEEAHEDRPLEINLTTEPAKASTPRPENFEQNPASQFKGMQVV